MTGSIDITRGMKKIVLTLSLLTISICLKAQLTSSGLTVSEFNSISINGVINLSEVQDQANGISILKSRLLNVTGDQTETSRFVSDIRTLSTTGFKILYEESGDNWDFFKLEITTSNFYLKYNNVNVKVGDSISVIQNLFPTEYNGKINNQVSVKGSENSLVLSIYYGSDNKIDKITLNDFS